MTLTITVPDIEQFLADYPHAICTPTRGVARVLPSKATRLAEEMTWTWKTITRPIIIDGAHIRIGDRAGSFPLVGGKIRFRPGDTVELGATLAELKLT